MPQQIPSLESFLDKWVPSLPQGKHIDPEHAKNWYRTVCRQDPDRFTWHVKRLTGLGGSEIGEVVSWRRAEHSLFKTARDIAQDKLMITPPSAPNAIMRRGIQLEPMIQKEFLRIYNGESCVEALANLDKAKDPEHVWMRTTADDIVKIMDLHYVTDYKCPGNGASEDSTSQLYACQVHQGFHLARLNNIPVDGMIVAAYDWNQATVKPVEVEYDQTLLDDMLQGGDELWSMILGGKVPAYNKVEKSDLNLGDKEKETINKAEKTLMVAKTLGEQASALEKKALATIQKTLQLGIGEKEFLKGHKFPLENLTGVPRQTIDYQLAEQMLVENGQNLNDFMTLGKDLDKKKVSEYLVEQGKDLSDFTQTKLDQQKIISYAEECGLKAPFKESFSAQIKKKDAKEVKSKIEGVLEDGLLANVLEETSLRVFPQEVKVNTQADISQEDNGPTQ